MVRIFHRTWSFKWGWLRRWAEFCFGLAVATHYESVILTICLLWAGRWWINGCSVLTDASCFATRKTLDIAPLIFKRNILLLAFLCEIFIRANHPLGYLDSTSISPGEGEDDLAPFLKILLGYLETASFNNRSAISVRKTQIDWARMRIEARWQKHRCKISRKAQHIAIT